MSWVIIVAIFRLPTQAMNQPSIMALNIDKYHVLLYKSGGELPHIHLSPPPKTKSVNVNFGPPVRCSQSMLSCQNFKLPQVTLQFFLGILELNAQHIHSLLYEHAPFQYGQGTLFQTGAFLWNLIILTQSLTPSTLTVLVQTYPFPASTRHVISNRSFPLKSYHSYTAQLVQNPAHIHCYHAPFSFSGSLGIVCVPVGTRKGYLHFEVRIYSLESTTGYKQWQFLFYSQNLPFIVLVQWYTS